MSTGKTIHEPSRHVPVLREAEVLVVGGGPAGLAASVAAARLGARVCLVERYGCLGGLATGGLVIYIPGFRPEGSPTYGGIALELVQRVGRAGGALYHSRVRETEDVAMLDPELLKLAALELVVESGVDLVLHAWAVGALLEGRAVKGVFVESKSGRQAILARAVVDASGDADVVAWAGGEFITGSKGMSLPFRVGGVDWRAYESFWRERAEERARLSQELQQRGGMHLPRLPEGRVRHDQAWFNYWGLTGLNAVDVQDLTTAEVQLRRQAGEAVAFLRERVPGFAGVYLLDTASQIGTRDSRRIVGDYTLQLADLEGAATFPDAVGKICHSPRMDLECDVPYRCLVPRGLDNVLVSGRPISVEPRAHETTRLIPQCLVSGQAAGTAAALVARSGRSARDLDLGELQAALQGAGVRTRA